MEFLLFPSKLGDPLGVSKSIANSSLPSDTWIIIIWSSYYHLLYLSLAAICIPKYYTEMEVRKCIIKCICAVRHCLVFVVVAEDLWVVPLAMWSHTSYLIPILDIKRHKKVIVTNSCEMAAMFDIYPPKMGGLSVPHRSRSPQHIFVTFISRNFPISRISDTQNFVYTCIYMALPPERWTSNAGWLQSGISPE